MVEEEIGLAFRFKLAMLFCYIAYIIFPKCNFKENLKKIMSEQAQNFRLRQSLGIGYLKQQLEYEQIITNYDKIKNMTIDEMAEFIIRSICLSCIYLKENRDCKGKKCIVGIKQWLKAESK